MGDRLAEYVTAKAWDVVPGANGYLRHSNTGELVNARSATTGRSLASNASKMASQAAKRAGPGSGPAAAREAYAQALAELEAEGYTECPALDGEDLSDLLEIADLATNDGGGGAGAASGGRRSRRGGRSRRVRRQRGGALKDELKRLLRVLCAWPVQIAGYISDQANAGIAALAESLVRPDLIPMMAKGVVGTIPAALAVADLGSNHSLCVRMVTGIIQYIGTRVNTSITLGWYAGFAGNMLGFGQATVPVLASLAGVVVINYAAARAFQEIYSRVQAARGGVPSAAVLEESVGQFLVWMNKEAIYRVYPSIPEGVFKDSIRKRLTESLDAELASYMGRPVVPVQAAPFYPGPPRPVGLRPPAALMSLNDIAAAAAAGVPPLGANAQAAAALAGMGMGAGAGAGAGAGGPGGPGRGGRRRRRHTRRHKTKRTRKY